ncbi:MAG: hypothetical protein M1837_005071 [Sclerophora amabilis]|nr:MAG: hypothetical protein M1837_005071 [Sclerophora amabilis]
MSTPLFYYPFNYREPTHANASAGAPQPSEDERACRYNHGYVEHHRPDEIDSEDEDDRARGSRLHRGQQGLVSVKDAQPPQGNASKYHSRFSQPTILSKPPPPVSTSSSVDGYESFENTNNKKKRKIPTSGNASGHHSHLSLDMANMDLSSSHDAGLPTADETGGAAGQGQGTSYSTVSVAGSTGLSGPGRGRLGRSLGRNGAIRSPLAVTTDGSNARANGRGLRSQTKDLAPTLNLKSNNRFSAQPTQIYNQVLDGAMDQIGDHGIISSAIANAVEQGNQSPAGAQENVSLLQQEASKKSTPIKTQFTFTPSADVTWPGGSFSTPGIQPPGLMTPSSGTVSGLTPSHGRVSRDMSTQGTQTSPTVASGGRTSHGAVPSRHAAASVRQDQQQIPQQGKKPRPRRTGKQYALAARQRRLQQEYSNYHNAPNSDDIWICEFCEYESIFGSPPEALMRQYEIKDRRERRRLAEKRRLLEKAKLKGRKGKKGNKAAAKNAAATASGQPQPTQQHQQPNHFPVERTQTQSQGTQIDDGLGDDFDDELADYMKGGDGVLPQSQAANPDTLNVQNGLRDTYGISGSGIPA